MRSAAAGLLAGALLLSACERTPQPSPQRTRMVTVAEKSFMGRTVSEWRQRVSPNSEDFEEAIAECAADLETGVPLLVAMASLSNRDSFRIYRLIVRRMGIEAAPMLAELGRTAETPEERAAALMLLSDFGSEALPWAEDAAGLLREGIEANDEDLVPAAREVLINIGPAASTALLPLTKDESANSLVFGILENYQFASLHYLDQIDTADDEELEAEVRRRRAAMRSRELPLFLYSARAKENASRLNLDDPFLTATGFSEDDARELRVHNLDAYAALLQLVRILEDPPNPRMRRKAIEALGAFGPEAEPALPMLIEALDDRHAHTRRVTAATIMQMGPAAEDAVPALLDLLVNERDGYDQVHVITALGQIGPAAEPAFDAIAAHTHQEGLSDLSRELPEMRYAMCLLALANIDVQRAGPYLLEGMADRKWSMRGPVAQFTAMAGPAALPVLAEAFRSEDPQVRLAGACGLMWLGRDDPVAYLVLAESEAGPDEPEVGHIIEEARSRLEALSRSES